MNAVRFAAPAALWLLLLLPLIIVLYMLRSRREPMPVSSILLWQRTRRDLAAQLPIRRLERSVLLLLQLLAVAAAALALAQPQMRLAAGRGEATVFVIDLSASMQATDVAPSRFEAARRRALDRMQSVRGPVMVIGAGARPAIAAEWTNRDAALTALSRLQPTDGPAAVHQAIGLALAQRPAGGPATSRVVVFTDGSQERTSPVAGVEYVIVGRESRNVGITRVHAEPVPGGTHVVVQIGNTGAQAEQVPLSISLDGRRVVSARVSVPAHGTAVSTAVVNGDGAIKAEVLVQDFLTADNTAYGIAGRARPRVLVVGETDRALGEALAAAEAARLSVPRITPETLTLADVVILNGTPPVSLPPGNYLLIGTTAPNLPVAVDGIVRNPVTLRWRRGHPVLRYVDLSSVQIAETLNLRPAGGEVLAEGQVPLLWAYTGSGIRAVILGFSLTNTDLALHPAFPILLSNALEWLAGPALVLEAGQPLVVTARGEREARLIDPAGLARALVARDGVFTVPSLDRAGLYTLQGRQRRQFVVSVPAAESEIAPHTPPSSATQTARAAVDRAVSIWPLLIGAAVALLCLEWLLWLRTLPRATPSRRARPSGRALRPTSG
ncbi:MAG: VWA domain-containing protein [Armatimonadetes bacterium]|nr:VWA domain-containing protein [Armatimonadota bacterium]